MRAPRRRHAGLETARQAAAAPQPPAAPGQPVTAAEQQLAAAEKQLAALADTARQATAVWEAQRRQAAELRVARERKLLALGAGNRAALHRAQAALQTLPQPSTCGERQ